MRFLKNVLILKFVFLQFPQFCVFNVTINNIKMLVWVNITKISSLGLARCAQWDILFNLRAS